MLVSAYGFEDSGLSADPSRIAAQVVSGIGFIGAGTIIARPGQPRGLTTAASLWTAAGIGLACGVGMYVIAVAATVLSLFVLEPLKWLEERYHNRPHTQQAQTDDGHGHVARRRRARQYHRQA
jgi:putative Mg2+ transporter-C (MgtC) family protein